MDDTGGLLSKAEIARLLEITRPAVTVWQRRYGDFPSPVRKGKVELFSVDELGAWLANHVIPADVRHPHEPSGVTYADRLRRSLGQQQGTGPSVREQAEHLVERLVPIGEGFPSRSHYLDLVLTLLFVRCRYPAQWARLLHAAQSAEPAKSLDAAMRPSLDVLVADHEEPTEGRRRYLIPRERHDEVATVVRILDSVPPASPDQPSDSLAPVLFDRLVDRLVTLEGRLATDYNTPASVVRLMARLVAPIPARSRIHDPYCRAGDLLKEAVTQLVDDGSEVAGVTITGRDPISNRCRLARMRLALIGVSADLTLGHEYGTADPPPDLGQYDVVLTDPPFNSWGPVSRHYSDFRWPFGKPPANENFAWLQYAVYLLREGGRAVVVMASNATFSSHTQEQSIRRKMVQDDAVECVIALPSQLFTGTAIAPTLWVLRHPSTRGDRVLFIDASSLGKMHSRVRRVLSADDINKVVDAYRTGCRAPDSSTGPREINGISRSVTVSEIRDRDFSLNPATYVDPPPGGGVPSAADLLDMIGRLEDLDSQAVEIDDEVRELVRRIDPWTH